MTAIEAREEAMSGLAALPVTRTLAEACRAIDYTSLSEDARFAAKQCILDWVGVALAGSREPLAAILRAQVLEEGGNAQATLVGTPDRATCAQAALVNGATSHALDYDDVHMSMSGHPSVPVLPALLALAEYKGASGRDVMAALVAGFEMECRIGKLVMPAHYAIGFHATGTLGTFGAAAACAHLLRLDEGAWGHALGIAGSQAAGLKSMFGTMTKPLQAGKAAANGLLAATLAARGFTANPEVLETTQGFAATQTSTVNAETALEGLGESFAIRDTLFKYHAACYGTHETIEAVHRLKREHNLSPADVRTIRLRVPPGNLRMCNIQEPRTALEGKFSLRFTAALAIAGDETGESAFTDAAVAEPALVALRDRVSVEPAPAGGAGGTTVTIELASGATLTGKADLTVPAADLDWQWQQLAAKFRGLAAPVVGTGRTEELVRAIAAIEDSDDIGELVRLAVPAPAGAVA
jgi:2-methylcitrate dehydratase PrpD